jgi:hypothetical protein
MEPTQAKTPVHLWIVGVLATLWNGFGGFDYYMTRTNGAEWIRSMMPGADADGFMAYINAFPVWASLGWGLGVWAGLAGSLLLLVRSRWAAPVLSLSLIGAVVGIGYQLVHPTDAAGFDGGMSAMMPYVVLLIAAALAYYAHRQRATGVLL